MSEKGTKLVGRFFIYRDISIWPLFYMVVRQKNASSESFRRIWQHKKFCLNAFFVMDRIESSLVETIARWIFYRPIIKIYCIVYIKRSQLMYIPYCN
jgi:hypothetical protein